ncbi:MAG: phosphodiester glycosidase family protein [Planctomycetota bacterium]
MTPPPSRAARCRHLLLGLLLALVVLAWIAKQLGFDALFAQVPFPGRVALGDARAPLVVESVRQLQPPSSLVVAKVPRRGGYGLGLERTVPGALALSGIGAPARRRSALVAINGDYHRLGESLCYALPFSTFLEGETWHALGSPYGYSCQFWLDQEGAPHVGRLDLRGQLALPDGPLDVYLNEELGEALVLLAAPGAWRVPEGRVAVPLEQVEPRVLRVRGRAVEAGVELSGPALLVEVGPSDPRARALEVGQRLELTQAGADAGKPRLVVGTGPRLLVDGQVAQVLEDPADLGWTISLPRTAIGFDDDAVYLVTTAQDPRAGMSLEGFARALAQLGCKQAVNLDGGPSSSLWVVDHGVVNGGFEPEVGTAVLAFEGDGVELR